MIFDFYSMHQLLATTMKLASHHFILYIFSSFQRNLLLYGSALAGPAFVSFLVIDSTKVDND